MLLECADGHKNPSFQQKFVFTLIEGLREIAVHVWNSNSLSSDDFIGSGKYAGEARLILYLVNSGLQRPKSYSNSVPPAPPAPPVYVAHYGVATTAYPTASAYSAYPPPSSVDPQPPFHPPPPPAYPPPLYPLYSVYPPPPYPPVPYPGHYPQHH